MMHKICFFFNAEFFDLLKPVLKLEEIRLQC